MPVIRPDSRWHVESPRQTLVDQLVAELAGGRSEPGAVVFEMPVEENQTLHVIVVWSKWEGIPDDDRSSIILEAYAIYDATNPGQEPRTPRITIAVGVTPEEAVATDDLLPFVLVPGLERSHPLYEQARRDMIEAGGIELPTRIELRFPTLQMAREARQRLRKYPFKAIVDHSREITEIVSCSGD